MHPQAKIYVGFEYTRLCPVQSSWEADWAKLWHLHSVLADSKAVAKQVQTLILEEKMKKSGAGGGV